MSEDSKNTSLIPSDREPYTSRTLTFKLTNSEYKAIKEQAIKYANGNVSAWIRYAAIHMVPLGEHINKATSEQLGELSLGDINSADSNI